MRGILTVLAAGCRRCPGLAHPPPPPQAIEADVRTRGYISRTPLCTSLAGNPVDLLTVTAPTTRPELLKRRKGVILSGA
jgi:hypothetical protein